MSEYQLTNLEDPDVEEGEGNVIIKEPSRRRWTKSRILAAAAWVALGSMIVVGIVVYYTCLSKNSEEVPKSQPLNLFVFGDSYSSIEFDPTGEQPSPLNPLGNPPFPGNSRDRLPNWVGWLTTEFNKSLTLAYDYAISGGAVETTWQEGEKVRGYIQQVTEDFVPYAGKQLNISWTSDNSFFSTPLLPRTFDMRDGWVNDRLMVVSWIGINDVRLDKDVHDCMTQLFDMTEVLYLNGARKIIYMTVPPLERTPADWGGWYKERVLNWNTNLTSAIAQYNSLRLDIELEIYDTAKIFNRVIDDPTGYGFINAWKVCNEKECIWFDDFHPGSAFYKVLARDFAEFLEEKFTAAGRNVGRDG